MGDIPVIVCGDFNTKIENSAVLTEVSSAGAWIDAAGVISSALGTEPEVTFVSYCAESRIDLAFLNPMAARLLNNAQVLEVPDHGIKLHRPLRVTLDFSCAREFAYTTPKIRGFPPAVYKMGADDMEQLGNEIVERYARSFYGAWETGDVDAVWEEWCKLAESYIVEKAAVESGQHEIINDARYLGRGKASTVLRVRVGRASCTSQGVCIDAERRELQKLTECLRELTLICETGNEQHCASLWSKICRVGQQVLPNAPFRQAWMTSTLPTKGALQSLMTASNDVLDKVSKGDRERFIRNYQRRIIEKSKKNIKDLAKHFRDPEQGPMSILKREDGSITGRISEMDELLRKCWLPIFAKHDESNPEPNAEDFMNKYGNRIPRVPQGLPTITLEDLRSALGRIPSSGAGGLDGWTPADLKQLPDQIMEMLLPLFDLIESSGVWPESLAWAGITLIPKGEGGAPLSLRPITVTPIVYRVWASVRMRHSNEWQESWIHRNQHGARAKHSTMNALAKISLYLEKALLDGDPGFGIAVDLAKAFDNVPIAITFEICRKMGMAPEILQALRGMYKQIKRRFKIGTYVGEAFVSTNGILQGCPLSVMLLNALMCTLTLCLEDHVETTSFVDDLTLMSKDVVNLQRAMDVLEEFMTDTHQKVNASKTKAFKLCGDLTISLQGEQVDIASEVKILGVKFHFADSNFLLTVPDDNVEKAVKLAHRIRFSGMPFHLRNLLNGMLVLPKIFYGIEVQDLSAEKERRLRTAVSYSLWKKTSKERSVGLLLTIPVKGHVVDPAQGTHVRRWLTLKRVLHTSPEISEKLCYLYEKKRRHRRYRRGGFVENLLLSAKRLLLHAEPEGEPEGLGVRQGDGGTVRIEDVRASDWAHNIRELARRAVWTGLDKERGREGRIPWGIAAGINTDRTRALYESSDAQHQGILRKILLNAVWTQTRRAHMPGNDESRICSCGAADETLTHLWWECSNWKSIREKHGCEALPYKEWSPALRDLGIVTATDYQTSVVCIHKMMIDIFKERYKGLG